MAASVYIETTIVSYLTACPSRDLVQRAHQQLTRRWWRTRRAHFDLHVSPPVLQEAAAGDNLRARRRLAALTGVPILDASTDAMRLAETLAGKCGSDAGGCGGDTHRDCDGSRDDLSFDVELRTHRECHDENPYRNHLSRSGLRTAGFMYPGRADGGLSL